MKELGIAVSTYSNEKTTNERIEVIIESLTSIVKNTPDNCYLCIVDDGTTNEKHLMFLNKLKNDGIHIIRRNTNGGVSYAKNIGINYLLGKKVKMGFLVDDDLIINNKDFANYYYDVYKKTGIHHFNFIVKIFHPQILDDDNNIKPNFIKEINNTKIVISPLVNGCLLTFTPKMIEKIGYYEIYPYKYGQSHVNFTYRAIHNGFTKGLKFVDAFDTDRFFSTNPLSYRNFADPNIKKEFHAEKNSIYLNKNLNKYIELKI